MRTAIAKSSILRFDTLNRIKVYFSEPDCIRIPIIGILLNNHDITDAPLLETKRPVAYEITRLGPWIASIIRIPIFFNRRQMYWKPRVMIQERKKIRSSVVECDFQRLIINGTSSYLREVFQLSLVVGFGIFHQKKHVGIFGGQTWSQDALERTDKILGGNGFSICPLCIITQAKGVNSTIFRYIPTLSHPWNRM